KIRLLNTFRDGFNLSISPDKTSVLASYFSDFLTLRTYDSVYAETPTTRSGVVAADFVDVMAKTTPARFRLGDAAYELDPLTGTKQPMDWLNGKPVLPESGESWGIVQRQDHTLEIMDFDQHQTIAKLPPETKVPINIRQIPGGRRVALLYL